jgi:hypothetical protein
VALLVGGLFGPLIGWLVGTFAAFITSVLIDDSGNNVRGMRISAFLGGLIGIPLGLVEGLAVSTSLRVLSTRVLKFLNNPWLAAPVGAVIGWFGGFLILIYWYSSYGTVIYVGIHSMAVGGVVGAVTVLARPKWL